MQGGAVSASDISSSMANEAQRRYEQAVASGQQAPSQAPTFSATDLESISGSFHTVICLDVMIHYPQVLGLWVHVMYDQNPLQETENGALSSDSWNPARCCQKHRPVLLGKKAQHVELF